jgi:6-phosphogluconolactonase (cycloisomerase 2 family)
MFKIEIALLALLALLPLSAFAAPVTPTVTLAASIEKPICPEGQPVFLALALHSNGTDRFIIGGSAFEESSFQINVTDSAGKAVPRTAIGERVLTPPMAVFANSTVALTPGQTLSYRFNLARLFDLSRTGTYTVDVSRRLRPQVWPPEINLLTPPSTKTSPVTPPSVTETPQEFTLTANHLTLHMTEDAAAVSGPTALALPPAHQTFMYMASRYNPGISRYRVGDDGGLSLAFDPDTDSPYALVPDPSIGAGTGSLVITPDGHYLYTSDSVGVVSQFHIGDDGVLIPLSPPTVPVVQRPGPWYSVHPGTLLMDPKGRFLYNLAGALYAIGPDGRLAVLPPSPPDVCYTVSPDGQLTALPKPPSTALYAVSPDGRLTTQSQLLPGPATPDGGHYRAVALSPSSRFAFVLTSTSLTSVDDLVVPTRVAADGALVPLPGAQKPQTPPLSLIGFRSFNCTTLAVDPTGRFLVVVNHDFLDCFRIGTDGSLTPLGMTTKQGDLDAAFFVPGSPIVYVHNSNPQSFLAFRLDERRGLIPAGLDLPNQVPFDMGIAPVAAVVPTPPKWGPYADGLEVSARLPADVLPANNPVVLTVLIRNVTSRPIRLGTGGSDMASFRLTLIGPQRQSSGVLGGGETARTAVPLLAAGHDLLDVSDTSGGALVLPPGGLRQYQFVLSRLADLTVAGHYTVQISRILPGGAKAASPILHLLIEGPYNGITRSGNGSELDVF